MKQSPKEKLNDKARKMIDLIYDEVRYGGERSITSTFTDKKVNSQYTLTVKIGVVDPREIPEDITDLLDDTTENTNTETPNTDIEPET